MAPSFSAFLALPAEIRLLVYEHLFVPSSAYIDPTTTTKAIRQSQRPTSSALHLLLTCRQIRAEAHNIAYKKHTFDVQRSFPAGYLQGLAQQVPHCLITSLLLQHPYAIIVSHCLDLRKIGNI